MGLNESSLNRFSVAILIASSVAFSTLTVGVFSPAWFVVERHGVHISEGPWYTRACPTARGDCVISTREMIYGVHSDGRGDSALRDEHWFAMKIELTAAVTLALLGVGLSVLAFWHRNCSSVQWIFIAGGTAVLPSSILSLVAVLKVMAVSDNLNTSTPWSRDVTFAGSVAAFGTSCLYIFAISQSCARSMKIKRQKRLSSSLDVTQTSEQQSQTVQFILLDNSFHNGSTSHLRQVAEESVCEGRSEIPGKYPNQPPAYSEIYGPNATI